MSTTLQVLTHLPGAVVAAAPEAATNGLLDWASAKIDQLEVVLKAFSIVAAIGFVIWQGVSSRGAMARIVIAGLAAGLFVWIVWNVTSLQNRVGSEVSMGSVLVQESGPHTAVAADILTDPHSVPTRLRRSAQLSPVPAQVQQASTPTYVPTLSSTAGATSTSAA